MSFENVVFLFIPRDRDEVVVISKIVRIVLIVVDVVTLLWWHNFFRGKELRKVKQSGASILIPYEVACVLK